MNIYEWNVYLDELLKERGRGYYYGRVVEDTIGYKLEVQNPKGNVAFLKVEIGGNVKETEETKKRVVEWVDEYVEGIRGKCKGHKWVEDGAPEKTMRCAYCGFIGNPFAWLEG